MSFSVICIKGRTLNERAGKYGAEEVTWTKLRNKRRTVKKTA
jgi:hypothetical protein